MPPLGNDPARLRGRGQLASKPVLAGKFQRRRFDYESIAFIVAQQKLQQALPAQPVIVCQPAAVVLNRLLCHRIRLARIISPSLYTMIASARLTTGLQQSPTSAAPCHASSRMQGRLVDWEIGLFVPTKITRSQPIYQLTTYQYSGGYACCAWIAVITTVLMMSSTVQPRLRSLTGLFRPCNTGPMAMAPVSRWTAL